MPTFAPSNANPEVFFSRASETDSGPLHLNPKVTFANALKSGLLPPAQTTQTNNRTPLTMYTESATDQNHQPLKQNATHIEAMMHPLQKSIMEFMSFMRTTMQDIMRNQTLLIQMLVSQQSK